MRICFYAAVDDLDLLELVEFYRQDICALRALGHEVGLARRPRDLRPHHNQAYWIWWPTSGAPAVLAGRLYRRPVVLVTAISNRDSTSAGLRAKPRLTMAAARFSMRSADLVLATSDDTRHGLMGYGIKRLSTGWLGVDTEFYRPDTRVHGTEQVLTISHLTRDNVERKRLIDVVRTAALLRTRRPRARFIIAGKHADGASSVLKEIDRLGLQAVVKLPGQISREEKRELLARSAVYFQPSRYEAFGLAIAEAMACGAPVLSSRVGAVPEVVGDAGLLMGDTTGPPQFAEELDALLRDQDRLELGARGRARIQRHFSYDARKDVVKSALAAVGV